MSNPKSTSAPTEPELDVIAADLYALRPDAFAAARDQTVAAARADGHQPLARELGKLRRPTQSAWLVNLLWRDQADALEQLFALAADLSQAQSSGRDLQSLTARRRELETTLIQGARRLAEQADVAFTANLEREVYDTLAAALASPEVADEVRSGRLVKPATYAGFGTLSAVSSLAAQRREAPGHESRAGASERPKQSSPPRPVAEQAQRRVDEARAAVEAAAEALSEHDRVAEAARQREQDLLGQVKQVDAQLRDLKVDLAAVRGAAVAASRRQEQAEKAHTAALRTLESAEQARDRSPK